jgi:hypothetical protein
MFVADDLVAWLIGLLADAGRKKLTTLILGSDQERALRQAVVAAVERTAEQLAQSGGEQAEQMAMVVDEVFREPAPTAALAGQATLLEALEAEIVENLAVLDDPALTGTGRSSAELLGSLRPRAIRVKKDRVGATEPCRVGRSEGWSWGWALRVVFAPVVLFSCSSSGVGRPVACGRRPGVSRRGLRRRRPARGPSLAHAPVALGLAGLPSSVVLG